MNRFPLYLFLLLFAILSCQSLPKHTATKLRQGDLLFKDTQNDSIASAIKEVTPSLDAYSFSHVGVAFKQEGEWKVIEAIPSAGVRITNLESFLSPAKGEITKVVVGRLKKQYNFDFQKLITYGKAQLGKAYDKAFVWNEESFYCSELVYQMFANAGQKEAFIPKPMTFKEKGTEQFHPTWVLYYKKLGIAIPEGDLGINPNGMARSKSVQLLFELR